MSKHTNGASKGEAPFFVQGRVVVLLAPTQPQNLPDASDAECNPTPSEEEGVKNLTCHLKHAFLIDVTPLMSAPRAIRLWDAMILSVEKLPTPNTGILGDL